MKQMPFATATAAGLALALTLVARAAGPASPTALTLHAPLATDLQSTVGPGGAAGASAPEFASQDGTACVRMKLPTTDPRVAPTVVATWPARGLLSNAQGAVAFRIRAHKVRDKQDKLMALLRLVETGGGTWTLRVAEKPYTPPADAAPTSPHEARQRADDVMDAIAGHPAGADSGERDDKLLDEIQHGPVPVGVLRVDADLKLFPEAELTRTVDATANLHAKGAWHTVLWTWRSVHHDVYVDGRRCGGGTAIASLSRLAPFTADAPRLELLAADVDVADVRLYNRYLDPSAAIVPEAGAGFPAGDGVAPFRLWADWAYVTGRTLVYADVAGLPDVARVMLSCIDESDGHTVAGPVTLAPLPNGLGETLVPVCAPDPFPAGAYHYEATAQTADGRAVAHARSPSWSSRELAAKRDTEWPWLGFQGGRREARKIAVLPPFTPLRVTSNTVATVTSEHALGRDGLFRSLRVNGGEILASAMRLDVLAGEERLAFDQGDGPAIDKTADDAVTWSATTRTAEGHSLEVRGAMEYDGVTTFDLTLTPRGTLAADRIELIIPYRPEIARLAHQGWSLWFVGMTPSNGTWGVHNINWGGVKPNRTRRDGVIFDALDFHASLFPPPSRFAFSPYVHVGNYDRGLSWFADNDNGWTHDPAGAPPMEFVARGEQAFLRLNVAARAVAIDRPWHIRFHTLPNPWKPLPKDWRSWCVGENSTTRNDMQRNSRHVFWFHWSEYAQEFHPYPGGGQSGKYEDWLGRFTNSPLYHCPFINFGTPGGIGFWDEQTMVLPYTWKLHNSPPHRDYVAYWMDKCRRDIGIRGVYVDEPYAEPHSYNVLAGDEAYIRDDGTRSIGFRYMEGREYFRRLKQVFADAGIDQSVWIHTTNYRAFPVFTFGDISMDGEHPSIWVPEFHEYDGFYDPERSRGYIGGAAMGMVGTMMFHGNTNPKGANAFEKIYRKCRSYLAVTLPFGVLPMRGSIDAEHDRVQNTRYALGVFDGEIADVHFGERYGDPDALGIRVQPDQLCFGGEVNRARHAALLYGQSHFLTEGPTDGEYAITPGFETLSLGAPHVHAWDAETGASLLTEAGLRLTKRPGDFSITWLEGRDVPQKPRPAGAILGLTFDAGLEPDFGGGLAPVQCDGEAAFVQGPSGRALAIAAASPAVSYAVVPSWVAGTIDLRLRLDKPGLHALRLFALRHHLELEVSAIQQADRPGLLLTTRELDPPITATPNAYAVGDQGDVRTCFAPLPDAAFDGWHRLTLVWTAGRYTLYWDGKPCGQLGRPAAPRLRDDTARARGVIVGQGAGNASSGAALDNVIVYDWALTPADLAGTPPGTGLAVVPRPAAPAALELWQQLRDKKHLLVGAAFTRHPRRDEADVLRFSLFRKGESAPPFATADVVPWCGTARANLDLDAAPPALEAVTQGDISLDADDGPADSDVLGDIDGEVVMHWSLRAELCRMVKDAPPEILAARDMDIDIDLLSGDP